MFGQHPASMPGGNGQVCSFYLKGQCKYGTQCWNLHPPNQSVAAGGMANTFGVGGNVFGAKTGTQGETKEFSEFVKQVSGEMTQWERSGQWLFSSFTPLKSHPLLSGFSDLSPEELRTKAYDALKANTSSAYQEHWSKLQQQYKQLRDALRAPTPDAYQALKDVFHAKGGPEQQQLQNQPQTGKTTGLFGKSSVFGGSATQPQPGAGLLGAKPQQSSVFGGGGSLFGTNQQASTDMFGETAKKTLFGGATTIGSQNPGTFAAQPNPSPFGGGSNTLFKSNTQNTLGTGSVFGGPPKLQGNPLFGGAAATSSAIPTSGTMFGSGGTVNTPTSSVGMFGGGAPVSTPVAGNMFGGGASTSTTTPVAGSIFGGSSTSVSAASTGNLFGGSTSTVTTTPATGSVFGGGQNQSSGIFGGGSQNPAAPFSAMGSGTTGSVFGNPNTPSVFGNPSTNETSGNMFGNKPSLFGGTAQNPPLQQQQNTNPLFGGSAISSNPGIFGAKPADTQVQNTAPSMFGGNAANPTFGSGSTLNPAGGTGLFGNAPSSAIQTTGVFGNTSESTSGAGLFGKPAEIQQTSQANVANPTVPTPATGGNRTLPTNVKEEWFTPLDQLVPSDKEQFESNVFTSIPMCPPPLELC